MAHHAYQFTHAITRRPGTTVVDGLRGDDKGSPDFQKICSDHQAYIATLREAGATVTELPALEAFPDALFVEDTALCLPEGAVLMRPGAESRIGEVKAMAPALRQFYYDIQVIESPGSIEGGDILTTATEILVGRSARTNREGIEALQQIVECWGYAVREVATPPGVLHFKTDCSLLDSQTILATERLAASGCFRDYRVLLTAAGEEAAANSIRYNDIVLMPAGFPKTADRLHRAGYKVREVSNTECAKIDGGMSCLSLRFTAP